MSNESFFSAGDKSTMKNFLLGGTAAGFSLATLTSLFNYLNTNNRDASSDDDDTLYIRKKNPAQKSASVATGLGIAGGTLAALTGYAIVRKLYQNIRKQEAQSKLDRAQEAMIDTQGYSKVANGGRPLSVMETLTASPIALAAILAIGSGVASNLGLERAFPKVQDKTPKPPRRIVVVDDDGTEKVASIDTDAIYEAMLLITAACKSASSDVYKLIAHTANGNLDDFIALKNEIGFSQALDSIKSAAFMEFDEPRMALACACLSHHPEIAEQVRALQSMEFAGDHPMYNSKAAALSSEEKRACLCLLGIVGETLRAEMLEPYILPAEKSASADTSLPIGYGLAAMLKRAAKETPTTELSGKEGDIPGQEASRKKYIFSRKTTRNVAATERDFIDDLLNPSRKPEDADTHSMQ